jgi:hypothetical protein
MDPPKPQCNSKYPHVAMKLMEHVLSPRRIEEEGINSTSSARINRCRCLQYVTKLSPGLLTKQHYQNSGAKSATFLQPPLTLARDFYHSTYDIAYTPVATSKAKVGVTGQNELSDIHHT